MLDHPHFQKIARELGLRTEQVAAVALLLDNDATLPFIARYRKEATGSLDEVAIAQIRDRLAQLRELDKRRETILKTIEEQGKLSDALKAQIEAAETMSVLEDLYLPYKPKRRTRATIAREKGLEPLSEKIFNQQNFDLEAEAQAYIDAEKGVSSLEEALAGARDIIAERINEDQQARAAIRHIFTQKGTYKAKVIPGKEEEGQKYKDYFEWEEKISEAPSHRVLALRRAEKEMIISLDLSPEDEEAIETLARQFITARNATTEHMELAVKDAYKRLLKSSMETEVRLLSKQKADEEAIKVFADNLRQLLLSAPLGQKNVLAIDPGFRTGCKVVCLDRQGKLLHHDVIYPDRRRTQATEAIQNFCIRFQIEAIAIGNGTGSRETEAFIKSIGLPPAILVVMVNESGASVYSASEVARDEFPDYDITVRGSVSIGRRLMDPLAELVKIDPKSIGVGQYQHDVDQNLLKKGLDEVVSSCVNSVGVEVNTASKELLTYVSGLGPQLAKNIVEYRDKNGAFPSREALKKVSRLGEKAFEQAAGFLRIRESANPLDASAVHPESYAIVAQMAKDLDCTVADLMQDAALRKKIDLKKYVNETVGLPTLHDIREELAKPGRDPREQFEAVTFAEGIHSIEDLRTGMQLNGIVTNITNFGAFVDIGVHQDGLVHISQMSHRFIKSPHEVVKVHQKVLVTVTEVEVARRRIALSMLGDTPDKSTAPATTKPKEKKPQPAKKTAPSPAKPQPAPEDDFQAKLAALKNKFK
ncbi:MAG: RNA-binding transcriptional accessory protein [Microscillaceae bacterium]|nr:RNA-binding transcriptional accessory protein [Microscillaceae bacterium]